MREAWLRLLDDAVFRGLVMNPDGNVAGIAVGWLLVRDVL